MNHEPISTRTGVVLVVVLIVFLIFALWAASSKAQTTIPKWEAPVCRNGYCVVQETTMIMILNDATRAYEYAKYCRWIKDRR